MKLLQRVMMLVRANINDMLERSEDPEQLLRQLQQDLRNQMMQVKTQVATAIAQEHKLQGRCEELTREATQWQHKAAALHRDHAQCAQTASGENRRNRTQYRTLADAPPARADAASRL